jgi:tungstate transport system substrate-binding protein
MARQSKKITYLFSILTALTVLLSACTAPTAAVQPAATEQPAATQAPVETQAPAATEAPTEAPVYPKPGAEGHLVLATTTSTADSGLLDYLLPMFEQEAGLKVDTIAVGTGQALKLGTDGNADVLLVHSRAQEDAFMAAGDGARREDVMFNDFVIVGPESDPAGIKGITSAADAFKKIQETQSKFLSRGDKSGTNTKELAIWKAAGVEPKGDWYISTGQGMGETLTMADEIQGYTLSDRATYLARGKQGLKLALLVEGDKALFNPYGVITVNPKKNPMIQAAMAEKFVDWIISVPVQEKIAEFGKKDFGQSLFTPSSKLWLEAQSAPAAATGLKLTGNVKTPQSWTDEQLKAMETMQVDYTDKQGITTTYTGVPISELLKLAEPNADATTVVFVGRDGFTAEVTLAEVMACPDCIIGFVDTGGYNVVMPGFPGKVNVRDVVEIQVK